MMNDDDDDDDNWCVCYCVGINLQFCGSFASIG